MIECPPVRAWPHGPDAPKLCEGEVHLWLFSASAEVSERAALRGLLSQDEQARAQRFALDHLARRHEVAHGRLRRLLAMYLKVEPSEIHFENGPHGKPFIASSQSAGRLAFSFAHSGDVVLTGVTSGRAIGVDVEVYRDRLDMQLVARRQFAPGEVAKLDRLSEDQREDVFYACWTRKEAYLKARGEGLAARLRDFEVTFLPDEPPGVVASSLGEGEPERWEVIPLDLGPRRAAACVAERPVNTVLCWTFEGAASVVRR